MRLGGPVPKQYQFLGDEMILTRSLRAVLASPQISHVVCAIDPTARDLYDAAARTFNDMRLLEPVAGGDSRAGSVLNALRALSGKDPNRVLIHDAARPFLPIDLVDKLCAAEDAAILAEPVVDALWREVDGTADHPVARAKLWRAQTPQAFPFREILAAHQADADSQEPALDDAETYRRAGHSVRLITGDPDNFKITTQADMARAKRLIAAYGMLGPVAETPTEISGTEHASAREGKESSMEVRTGHGFDVHRFANGDHVWLCGVKIPHTARLDGHSDADVGLHALADAVYGALADGDIGTHFPPSDLKWKGAESHIFLSHAAGRIAARGGRLVNADVTLLCEAPQIKPHAAAMRARMAEILETTPDRLSVKATTMERMGFIGREEGIGCIATATVEVPRP